MLASPSPVRVTVSAGYVSKRSWRGERLHFLAFLVDTGSAFLAKSLLEGNQQMAGPEFWGKADSACAVLSPQGGGFTYGQNKKGQGKQINL